MNTLSPSPIKKSYILTDNLSNENLRIGSKKAEKNLNIEKTTEYKKNIRDSSMELLRIVAMSMIVVLHFLSHGIKLENLPNNLYYFLTPFFICGVNLFFLISGYFQVKYSLKGILRLIFLVFFFGLINLLLLFYFVGYFSINNAIRLFLFPVSSSPYWFLAVYLILIIISPILNSFIKLLSIPQYNKFLIVFTFITVYNCGFGFNYAGRFGYSLIQCIYLYFVASYLRINKYFLKNWNKYYFLEIFFASTLTDSIVNYYHPNPIFISYNGIFILLSSLSLFMFFTRIKIQNRIINSLATAALGCYLLQDGTFGNGFFYSYMNEIYLNSSNFIDLLGKFSGIFIGFWILSWILTQIEKLWSVPLINYLYAKTPKKVKSLFDLKLEIKKS